MTRRSLKTKDEKRRRDNECWFEKLQKILKMSEDERKNIGKY